MVGELDLARNRLVHARVIDHERALLKVHCTGACTINRPCAQQYVGKSQSCMVISGRLIVHAPVQCSAFTHPTSGLESEDPKTVAAKVADAEEAKDLAERARLQVRI